MIKVDFSQACTFEELKSYQNQVDQYHVNLSTKTGLGSDFLGWTTWPFDYDKKEFELVKSLAKDIRNEADTFIVCGIGGSYLGSRAAIEMINGLYPKNPKVEVLFLGNTFSSTYILQVLDRIKDRNVFVNVISKSGTTTETAMAFRLVKQFMEQKYGQQEAKRRIIATTDKAKGTLKTLADKKGYTTLTIPDDIGGRYSVLTSVGLLPIAVAGIDIDAMMQGAQEAALKYKTSSLETNDAYAYAVSRRLLESKGKNIELLVSYESQMAMFAEWWKQLFGESEGKENKGLYPASVNFSTDLHSMGQFVQEGTKGLFETLIHIDTPTLDASFPSDAEDLDGMNYLAGKSLDEVNKNAALGTLQAHHDEGGIPVVQIHLAKMDAKHFGYVAQFFFIACGMSVYLLGVNPFNQPGVEVYKKNMFRLLGKK